MRPTGLDRRDQLRRDVDEILASERNGAITRIAETSVSYSHCRDNEAKEKLVWPPFHKN